jgi:hypothetical protein
VTSLDCAEFEAIASELALGTLTGRERAAALAHLECCIPCRRHLDSLTRAADMLLFLAPKIKPPTGFEGRVLARLEHGSQSRTRRFKRAAIAAAAVFALAAGVALTTTPRPHHAQSGLAPTPRNAPGVHVAQFVPAPGQQVEGQVISHTGNRSWIFLIVHDTDPTETYHCELELANGDHLTVGSFQLRNGTGSWGRLLDLHTNPIKAVHLRKDNGDTEATATIG